MVKVNFKKISETRVMTILNRLKDSGYITSSPRFDITKFGYNPMLHYPIFANSSLFITQEGIVLVESEDYKRLQFFLKIGAIAIPTAIAIIGLIMKN